MEYFLDLLSDFLFGGQAVSGVDLAFLGLIAKGIGGLLGKIPGLGSLIQKIPILGELFKDADPGMIARVLGTGISSIPGLIESEADKKQAREWVDQSVEEGKTARDIDMERYESTYRPMQDRYFSGATRLGDMGGDPTNPYNVYGSGPSSPYDLSSLFGGLLGGGQSHPGATPDFNPAAGGMPGGLQDSIERWRPHPTGPYVPPRVTAGPMPSGGMDLIDYMRQIRGGQALRTDNRAV
jgi:hypothetical protein